MPTESICADFSDDDIEAFCMDTLPDEGCAPFVAHVLACDPCHARFMKTHTFVQARQRAVAEFKKKPRPENLWVTLTGMPAPRFSVALVDSAFSEVGSTPGASFFRSQFFSHVCRGLLSAIDRPSFLTHPCFRSPDWVERPVKQALQPLARGSVVSQSAVKLLGRSNEIRPSRTNLPADFSEDPKRKGRRDKTERPTDRQLAKLC